MNMNYYIQGNEEKAEQIKAAFEAKDIDTSDWRFINTCDLYFNVGSHIYTIDYSIRHIVTGRQDYTFLELPIEPKFKVGDRIRWINHDVETQTITDIRDGSYITVDKYGIRCALKFAKQDEWELVPQTPHYAIANFQPFDKVLGRDYDEGVWICDLYSYYYKGDNKMGVDNAFVCVGDSHLQCIPYEGNEHLLGTTDMPSEEYINW